MSSPHTNGDCHALFYHDRFADCGGYGYDHDDNHFDYRDASQYNVVQSHGDTIRLLQNKRAHHKPCTDGNVCSSFVDAPMVLVNRWVRAQSLPVQLRVVDGK
ncbi:MAG: hypothetical protein HOP26_06025 [Methylotenera sp.]|nr:hypothetical protein [Methylotenera sp.]